MKPILLLVVALCAGCSAMRSPDEARTINECQRSHRQGQVPDSVVRSYCACMAESRATRGSVHLAPGGVADGRDHAACERRSGMR